MVMQSRVHYKILLRLISEFLLKQMNSHLFVLLNSDVRKGKCLCTHW